MQRIKDRLVTILRVGFGDTVGDAAAAGKDVLVDHLDSLDRLDFIAQVENTFDVALPNAVTVDMRTIDDVARYLETMRRAPVHGSH